MDLVTIAAVSATAVDPVVHDVETLCLLSAICLLTWPPETLYSCSCKFDVHTVIAPMSSAELVNLTKLQSS